MNQVQRESLLNKMEYSPAPVQFKVRREPDSRLKACALINSIQFFIEYVFIIKSGDRYRLVVKNNGTILTDNYYNDVQDAKIAFLKLYGHQSWSKKVRTQWSDFFEPDSEWMACALYIYNYFH